jgi:hypothetical protein
MSSSSLDVRVNQNLEVGASAVAIFLGLTSIVSGLLGDDNHHMILPRIIIGALAIVIGLLIMWAHRNDGNN